MLNASELEGKTLYPLSRVFELGPLQSVLSGLREAAAPVLDKLYYTDALFSEVANGWLASATVVVDGEAALGVPGLDLFSLVLGQGTGVTGLNLEAEVVMDPLLTSFRLSLRQFEIKLRVSRDILCPVKPGTHEPDPDAKGLDIPLGTVDLTLDSNGGVDFNFTSAGLTLPPCLLGSTGVFVQIKTARWLTPSVPETDRPTNTPLDFTGVYADDVEVSIPGVPGTFRMDDAFIGTGGFSGTIAETGLALAWDKSRKKFTGDLAGELFGFQGGLKEVSLEFKQSTLTGCSITGDVFVPYFDKRVGLNLGISSSSGLTAAAGLPFSTAVDPDDDSAAAAPSSPEFLLSLKLGDFFEFDLAKLKFELPPQGPAVVELSGQAIIKFNEKSPPVAFDGLRIDTDGHVSLAGGWIDLAQQALVSFNGFSLEISKIGFGTFDNGRRWIGLNGGLHLAQGLPLGAAAEGLRISWDPQAADWLDTIGVSLDGVGLEVTVPDVFSFKGAVAFFEDDQVKGFRGSVKLSLIQLKLTVDCELVIGKSHDGVTFFYFYLSVDLPAGIPLFTTGAAIFGFQGLLASHMAPNRKPDEPWYYGWYLRAPKGATSGQKWGFERGAFAIGLGTTIGTASDNGFVIHAKVLLILVLPGPRLLLEGKGNFVKQRGDAKMEGAFEALLALDFPACLFQFNLSVTFKIPDLLVVSGGLDVAFSWAAVPPPDMWHVYLGEKSPEERRWRADLLSIIQGYSYFQLWNNRMLLGAGIGIKKDWTYGPVRAWVNVSLNGEADVRYMAVPPGTERAVQFDAWLQLIGEAGLTVFGGGLHILLDALAKAKGPTPWFLSINVHLEIKIDLWVKTFTWAKDLPLVWGDENQPLPLPVLPVVEQIAWEHPKVIERTDDKPALLEGALLPPDGRPLILFKRPVRDLASLGAPGLPGLPAEVVVQDKCEFSYQLHHLVLVRTDGGQRLIGAAGVLHAQSGAVTLPGIASLPSAAGGKLQFLDAASLDVISSTGNALVLSGAVADGDHAYRLFGPIPKAQVTVLSARMAGKGAAEVILTAATGLAKDACGGGKLTAGSSEWDVLSHDGASVFIRSTSTLPVAGPALLTAKESSALEGVWLPCDNDPAPTKLRLWAKTPFTYFRHNSREVAEGFDLHNPDYACGPQAVEEPICADFDDLPLGILHGPFATELLSGEAQGETRVQAATKDPKNHYLAVGVAPQGYGGHGSVSLIFDPPVDQVWIHCYTNEGGEVQAWSQERLLGKAWVPKGPEIHCLEFAGSIDKVIVQGSLVYWHRVCFLPGWTCVNFNEQNFPQKSTGRRTYQGVDFETSGTMTVSNSILQVIPPSVGKPPYKPPTKPKPPFDNHFFNPAWKRERFEVNPRLPHTIDPGPLVIETPWPELALNLKGQHLEVPGVGAIRLEAGKLHAEMNRLDFQTSAKRMLSTKPASMPPKPKPITGTALLTIYLPQPVTRVRLDLAGACLATAFAGNLQIDQAQGQAGDKLALLARSAWIDRVVLIAPDYINLQRLCYDAGEFGWKRYEQWAWRMSTLHNIESFYQEDPVLAPGQYQLDVVTAWDNEKDAQPPQSELTSAAFTVGPPPGLGTGTDPQRYPAGGPLKDLALYVDRTVPVNGGKPFYRAYNMNVAFNETYITRMYLAAQAPLQIAVYDATGAERRPNSPVIWGRGHSLNLSHEEETWTKTLHNDGTRTCASIDMDYAVRDEELTAGNGELLAAEALHAAVLSADGKPVYRFEFTTSRYADFTHQAASYDGQCRKLTATGQVNATSWLALVIAARQTLAQAVTAFTTAQNKINQSNPLAADFEAYHAAQQALEQARAALLPIQQQAFETAWTALGLANIAALPERVEISQLPGALVLSSPEPMHWERVTLEAKRSTRQPLRQEEITFDQDFGAPDMGDFTYAGLAWTTNLELAVKDKAVFTRLQTPWTLTLNLDQALSVEMDVTLAASSSATLQGQGSNVSPDDTRSAGSQPLTATLKITGSNLTAAILSGTSIFLQAVRIQKVFVPVLPSGPARLLSAALPVNAADKQHHVDLLGFEATDLTGWSIQYYPASDPTQIFTYRTFATGYLSEARPARIYAGLVAGPTEPNIDLYFGGSGHTPPVDGAVFQLVDPKGNVRHELVVLPNSAYTLMALTVLPNADTTKAFLFPATGSLAPGLWQLTLIFNRQADPDLPMLSVGGNKEAERAILYFVAGN